MASLRRLPNSPYWIACITLPDGRQTQRSTGVPIGGIRPSDLKGLRAYLEKLFEAKVTLPERSNLVSAMDARESRELAKRIADHLEDASRAAMAGRLTEIRARKTIADIFAMANTDALQSSTINDFFDAWLKRKELEAGEKTHERYRGIIQQLKAFLGPRVARDITHLDRKQLTAFRDSLIKRVTPGTVNISLKVIRSALAQARRDGLIDVNEAERVSLLKRGRPFERRPFSMPELKRILEVATAEWRGMILFGLYTGQRLGDIADLSWNNIDLQRGEIRLVTEKTARRQIMPMATPLARFVEAMQASDDPNAPLFPDAFAMRQRNRQSATLSNQFYGILVAAGLVKPKPHRSTGKGRSAKREQNELSFHSLRHTATSLLKNAGVSDAVAHEFIGHDSSAVSRAYTHIDTETLRRAASHFPDVLNG